jgi:hypothetical protein
LSLLAINHHYYRLTSSGYGIYPVTPRQLHGEVIKIRESGWRIGTEEDVVAFVSGQLKPRDKVAVITFDDGLKEQIQAIKDLQDIGAAAICYVPTVPIIDEIVLDVHKLQMIRAKVDDHDLAKELTNSFSFENHVFDDELLSIQYRYDNLVARRIKYFLNFILTEDEKVQWLAKYFCSLFGSEKSVSNKLYMSKSELVLLSKQGMLGSHAHSHVPLSGVTDGVLEEELSKSAQILEDITGKKMLGISYPFGGKSAVSDKVFRESQKHGYNYGWTMTRGVNKERAEFDPLALERIDVNDIDNWLT